MSTIISTRDRPATRSSRMRVWMRASTPKARLEVMKLPFPE